MRRYDVRPSPWAQHGYLRGSTPRPFRFIKPLLCRNDLAELANQLGLLDTAVEIGVFRGDFSATNLARWRGRHYYMIDAWVHRTNDTKQSGERSDNNERESRPHDERYAAAEAATRQWASRRTMIRAFSLPAAALFDNHSIDWLYVDALHTEAAVRHAPVTTAVVSPNLRLSTRKRC